MIWYIERDSGEQWSIENTYTVSIAIQNRVRTIFDYISRKCRPLNIGREGQDQVSKRGRKRRPKHKRLLISVTNHRPKRKGWLRSWLMLKRRRSAPRQIGCTVEMHTKSKLCLTTATLDPLMRQPMSRVVSWDVAALQTLSKNLCTACQQVYDSVQHVHILGQRPTCTHIRSMADMYIYSINDHHVHTYSVNVRHALMLFQWQTSTVLPLTS